MIIPMNPASDATPHSSGDPPNGRWQPPDGDLEQVADLVRIVRALNAMESLEKELVDAVRDARQHGRTWVDIATALRVTRQAARQRFGPQM